MERVSSESRLFFHLGECEDEVELEPLEDVPQPLSKGGEVEGGSVKLWCWLLLLLLF